MSMPKTGCNWSDGTAEPTPSSGNRDSSLKLCVQSKKAGGARVTKYSPFKNQPLWKNSALVAFALLGGIDLFMSISAISLDFIDAWWLRLAVIIGAYLVLFAITLFAKAYRAKNEVSLEIRGMKVTIKREIFLKRRAGKSYPLMKTLISRSTT